MNVQTDPASYRALERPAGEHWIEVIDQRALPHAVEHVRIGDCATAIRAIAEMWVRGAPLIGAVGAYGLALSLDEDRSDTHLAAMHAALDAARPTAINLRWALDRVYGVARREGAASRAEAAWREADAIVAEEAAANYAIGHHGLALLEDLARHLARPLNVMTHCNAGALATTAWGTATAPIFLAHAKGLPLQVWVSETRPRLQGANLTAWEMVQRAVPHTLIPDVASALLMQRGEVDVVIVGADRVAANGDTCNKIGTYEKALAAQDNRVPFYVALPSSTFDTALADGSTIPIETRSDKEVLWIAGRDEVGVARSVRIAPAGTRAVNHAFDVTPARLVTRLITERGALRPTRDDIAAMYPERFPR